ncbi:phospho-sugar mutase [Enterococcus cecorum]|uniref:phospho-sugar mutase n=1 Tax=Enterococcus cecorum TaxID=44008 RepID=UPI0025A385BE|nr:phospho-sugar mutase [Enterococcus cecorum]MDM8182857.1 phospho-sugar mutase [Enterococcus cecorum]
MSTRTKEEVLEEYSRWNKNIQNEVDLYEKLTKIASDEQAIIDAFYKNLSFGTGGLRGELGVGTNRMNIFTVGKASQGLANYVVTNFPEEQRKIAIAYDSRINSDVFAKTAAKVFAANGIKAYIYSELMPTPMLSFAVRELGCAAGIVITASHNPSKYNGYKVYGPDGCQITTEAASAILAEIEKLDIFTDVKKGDFNHLLSSGDIEYISEQVITDFIEAVKKESQLAADEIIDRNVSIVYTPLNGAGLKPILRALEESGYQNIHVVKEQAQPNGNFPTCPYPNPEIKEAMALGMRDAKAQNADLLLATDPDCDRVGIAVRNSKGEYQLLSGNETGLLLFDYICSQRIKHGNMPENPVMIKTIVTMDLAERIAKHYGVRVINVLTGFKFIGEQIGLLESEGHADDYIFGFEESYGYLTGSYVRDKDGVNAAFMICEMFAYYQTQGISLLDKLAEIYQTYGYSLNTLHSYEFEGAAGFEKMQNIMKEIRANLNQIAGMSIDEVKDYAKGIDGLPKSDVLKFFLSNGATVVVRPSGTEPKLKLYLSVLADNHEQAASFEQAIVDDMAKYFA